MKHHKAENQMSVKRATFCMSSNTLDENEWVSRQDINAWEAAYMIGSRSNLSRNDKLIPRVFELIHQLITARDQDEAKRST